MMEQSLMEFKNVSMIFENAKGLFGKKRKVGAVVDVNLKINSGDILAIVGESGCGKTTIGKRINGIYKPTAGEVNFMGKNIWALNRHEFFEYRRSVQMVHQDSYAALNPARSIFQSLSAPILQHKFAKNKVEAKTQLTELLKMVGLTPPEQFLDKYPHQLSGGKGKGYYWHELYLYVLSLLLLMSRFQWWMFLCEYRCWT